MGKASRWFRGLLGLKKSESSSSPSVKQPPPPPPPKEKRRWSFVKSHRDRDGQSQLTRELDPSGLDPERRAIAVAAATAAVAEAAVAAAQAAAAVVRLTSSGRCSAMYGRGAGDREEWAALKIQSVFRGYLARRALHALKGLVKIQALVRGHIERKKTAKKVQQMQAVLRLQARARAERGQISESSQSSSMSSHFHQSGPVTPEKSDRSARAKSMKHDRLFILQRNGSKSSGRSNSYQDRVHLGQNGAEYRIDERLWEQQDGFSMKNYPPEEENSDKILEVDMPKPLHSTKRKNLIPSTAHRRMELNPCPYSGEAQSLNPLRFTHEIEESPLCTADNSPQFYSACSQGGSRRSSFTPTKSDGSRSFLSGYADHPNYMAYTESSKAKVRSLSAPKQRPQFEKSVSTKRYSIHGFGDPRPASQVSSSLQANFASKAYPGSGRLDRLGMPIVRGGGGSAYRYYN